MIAYKLFRVRKDGSIGSLFINARARLPIGKWMKGRNYPTKGFAVRPGWHATGQPKAPHLSMKGRAWFEVEVKNYKKLVRPESQGGVWYLAKDMRIIGKLDEATKIKQQQRG